MKKKILSIFLALTLVLGGSLGAFGEGKSSAKVVDISGQVEVLRSGGEKSYPAFVDMRLAEGDRVITGEESSIKIQLDDDVTIELTENTIIDLAELRGKTGEKQSSIKIFIGGIISSIKKKLEGNSRFEIKTPISVMGVRGTEFLTQYANDQVDLKVLEGIVEVEVEGGSFLVGEMEEIDFKKGERFEDIVGRIRAFGLKGLSKGLLDRLLKMIEENPDLVPKEVLEGLEEAYAHALAMEEEKLARLGQDGGRTVQEARPNLEPDPEPEPDYSYTPPATKPPVNPGEDNENDDDDDDDNFLEDYTQVNDLFTSNLDLINGLLEINQTSTETLLYNFNIDGNGSSYETEIKARGWERETNALLSKMGNWYYIKNTGGILNLDFLEGGDHTITIYGRVRGSTEYQKADYSGTVLP